VSWFEDDSERFGNEKLWLVQGHHRRKLQFLYFDHQRNHHQMGQRDHHLQKVDNLGNDRKTLKNEINHIESFLKLIFERKMKPTLQKAVPITLRKLKPALQKVVPMCLRKLKPTLQKATPDLSES
jgi:phosphoenolpyruvate carboxylase